jgi:hypothetical protein
VLGLVVEDRVLHNLDATEVVNKDECGLCGYESKLNNEMSEESRGQVAELTSHATFGDGDGPDGCAITW